MDKLNELVKQKTAIEAEIVNVRKTETNEDVSEYFIRNCNFSFKCKQKWENLDDQGIFDIKYCRNCEREVFLCTSKENLINALHENLCVAIPLNLKDKKRVMLGSIIGSKK